MGILGKLHNIIVHSRSSANRTKEFVSFAQRRIPLDNSTRWNSWYQMLSTALDKESAIDNYVKANFTSLEKDYLSPQDWKALRTISSFYSLFIEQHWKLKVTVSHLINFSLQWMCLVNIWRSLYNIIVRTKIWLLGYNTLFASLKSIIVKQIALLSTLLHLYFIQIVVRSTQKSGGKKSIKRL